MKKKLLVFMMAALLVFSGCNSKTEPTGENTTEIVEDNKEVVEVVEEEKVDEPITLNLPGGDYGNLSPFTHYSRGPGSYKMALIFDGLLERGEEGIIPWLAENWEISDNGLDYVFNIHKDVKWQDGQDMIAEDIKFTLEYYTKFPPVSNSLNLDNHNFITGIEVLDPHSIKISVEKEDATLLEKFGTMKIIPKHIWENVEDPITFNAPEAVIGCGPYKLVEYEPELGAYKLEAFDEYWGPKPGADVIQFIPVSDSVLAFESGEIDLISVDPDIVGKYQENSEFKILQDPAFWGYQLHFNMEKRPELLDKNLRQAIAYAVNQEELVEKVGRGIGEPGSAGYLPVDHKMYNPDVKKYEFDLEKAKELLGGKTYTFKLNIRNGNSDARIAELIKINLEQIGINLEVISMDTKTSDAALRSGDFEIALNGYGGWGGDPDMLRTRYSSVDGSTIGYKNEELDTLLEEQRRFIDENARKEKVYQIQDVLAEEVISLPLYNTSSYTIFRPEKYDGWKHVFNHHEASHNKISFVEMK